MKPLSTRSYNCVLNSFSSTRAINISQFYILFTLTCLVFYVVLSPFWAFRCVFYCVGDVWGKRSKKWCVIITPWYADIVNFLASDILSPNLSYQQRKKLFSDIKHYLREDHSYTNCEQMEWSKDVFQRRNVKLFFTIDMIGRLEGTLKLQELQPKYYNQVFIGQFCSKMLIGISLHVINVKRQVISLASIKCQWIIYLSVTFLMYEA